MLRIEDADRVRLITLDRPDALNAFNNELYRAAREALEEAATRPDVGAVVVTGAGRAFSAGQDIAEMGEIASGDEPGFPAFIDTVIAFPKPLLAAVNGLGVGIGFTLLAHCDLVLIASDARLRTPFTTLGVAPEAASSVLFPAAMGWQAAAHVLLTSDWIDAETAVQTGIAWRRCDSDVLLAETLAVARHIASRPLSSVMATKELMVAGRIDAVRAARAREDFVFARLIGSPENVEAITAFFEKREPDFARLVDRG
ncbi:MAG TPA: enoyl-CoA hydratase-related protein [Acidimicrobiia bacterium]